MGHPVYAFHFLSLHELWIELGTGQHKLYPIHQYASSSGKQECCALPFWFAFTGCDTMLHLAGRGKKTAWNTWRAYPDVTETFVRSSTLNDHQHSTMKISFIRTSGLGDVNVCRRDLVDQLRNAHRQRMHRVSMQNEQSLSVTSG